MDTDNHRYHVCVIGEGEFDLIATTDDAPLAKRMAERCAQDYYYGTAIIDTETDMVDLGDKVVPVSEAFKD
jgi:hypothetical protein